MVILVLGIALWWASHLFPVYCTGRRAAAIARLGEGPYKGLFSLVTLASVALMVIGYRQAEVINLWFPPAWTIHLNNLLMVAAVVLMEARYFRSGVTHYVRHPMLTAVKLWAAAHLIVNGDLASVLLFGGLLGWAVVAMIGTNRRDGTWTRPPKGTLKGAALHGLFVLVVFGVILFIHWNLLGVRPFPG